MFLILSVLICLILFLVIEIILIRIGKKSLNDFKSSLESRLELSRSDHHEEILYEKYKQFLIDENGKEKIKRLELHLDIEKEIRTKDEDFPIVNKIIRLLFPSVGVLSTASIAIYNGTFKDNLSKTIGNLLYIDAYLTILIIVIELLFLTLASAKRLVYHQSLFNEKKRSIINIHLAVIAAVKKRD